jgi:hypothetical protein
MIRTLVGSGARRRGRLLTSLRPMRRIFSIRAVSALGALEAEAEPLNLSAGFAQEGKRITK